MNTLQVAVVDYGMGNVGSMLNMLRKLRVRGKLTRDEGELRAAERLILPGVGHFDHGMTNLANFGLIELLNQLVVAERKPMLGVCLGMQLMTRRSDEGELPGLGWFDAETLRFVPDAAARLRVPQMGWNDVFPTRPSLLFPDPAAEQRFYFVHSYFVRAAHRTEVAATATYGHDYDAALARDNILGVQFHPEKSHRYGLELLQRYVGGGVGAGK